MDRLLEELVALERSALDRWITPDPQGYLDLFHRGLRSDWRDVADHPQPLVVHTAGIEAAGFLNVGPRAERSLSVKGAAEGQSA